MEEIFGEKEIYKVQEKLLFFAAIFLIIRYFLYIVFQINQTINYSWSQQNLETILGIILPIGILITNFGYLFLLMLGISSNIKKIKENTRLEKAILALIFIAFIALIVTGIIYTIITFTFFDREISGYYNIISLNDGMLIARSFLDITTIMVILILTEKKLRKRLGQEQYGKRLVTPWLLIPIMVIWIGLLAKIISILKEHPVSRITDFYFWYKTSNPFPIFLLVCYIAAVVYGIIGISIGIEFLIKIIRIKKRNDLKIALKSKKENDLLIVEELKDEKTLQDVFIGREQIYAKNNSFKTIGILIIIRYCLFFLVTASYLLTTLLDYLNILANHISIILFLGVVMFYISSLLVVLHETSYKRKRRNYSRIEKVNFAFIVISIAIQYIFVICYFLFEEVIFFEDLYTWILNLMDGTILVRLFLDIITLTVIMILTDKIIKRRYGQEIYGKRMTTPWLFIPITITLIGLLINTILILIENRFENNMWFFPFWYCVKDSAPQFYFLSLIILAIYGLVGISLGIEFIIKNKKINKKIDYKSKKMFDEELEY